MSKNELPKNGDIVVITLLNGNTKTCLYLDGVFTIVGTQTIYEMYGHYPYIFRQQDILDWELYKPSK